MLQKNCKKGLIMSMLRLSFLFFIHLPLRFTKNTKTSHIHPFLHDSTKWQYASKNLKQIENTKQNNLYLWRILFVCLWQCWNLPNHGASCYAFGTIGKPLMNRIVLSSFHNVSTYDGQGIEYWTKIFNENSFNQK
jgi:hypothetical protein